MQRSSLVQNFCTAQAIQSPSFIQKSEPEFCSRVLCQVLCAKIRRVSIIFYLRLFATPGN
jgi:hypothetical protein